MPTTEERLSAIEALLATKPSHDWPIALLQAVSDKGRDATATLEMTFGPWEVKDYGDSVGQVSVSRTPLKQPAHNNRPSFYFRAVDSIYKSGVHFMGLHRKCTREEFDALIPTLQMIMDSVWSLMGAWLLDEETK